MSASVPDLRWVAETLGVPIVNYRPAPVRGFTLDSRETAYDEIFIALRGQRTDGHLFLEEAYRRGASGAIIAHDKLDLAQGLSNIIPVPEPARALWQLAQARRTESRTTTFIGITGSSGKTTTKELLYAILSRRYRAYRAPKNYNTEYGLPLALLNMPADTEIGIFELGLQRPGELGELIELLRPQIGVLTGIGDAHLGFFHDRQELARNKWELITRLPTDGLAVINHDSPYLRAWARELKDRKMTGFAIESEADYRASEIDDTQLTGLRFTLRTPDRRWKIKTGLLGRFNVYNILAATAVAHRLGMNYEDIEQALHGFRPVAHRMELKASRLGLLIDDSYNANPTSVKAALAALARLRTDKRKVLVLGDMLEQGDRAVEAHREIAEHILSSGVKTVFLLGELTRETADALELYRRRAWRGRVFRARDLQELKQLLHEELPDSDNLILVKGSRALALDRLVAALGFDQLASSF